MNKHGRPVVPGGAGGAMAPPNLEGIYNIQGDIWVKQDGEGFIWSEGRVCERMGCKESQKLVYIYSFARF